MVTTIWNNNFTTAERIDYGVSRIVCKRPIKNNDNIEFHFKFDEETAKRLELDRSGKGIEI